MGTSGDMAEMQSHMDDAAAQPVKNPEHMPVDGWRL